ncbi:MAG: extracellular solute-binding protein [Chloroflexi bacterium]|nr:extracellular solute-binding protein [Chloroflexota bacterium]
MTSATSNGTGRGRARFTRRRWLAALTAVATSSLAACGHATTEPPTATPIEPPKRMSRYTVRVRAMHDQHNESIYPAIAADYNATHSDTQLHVELSGAVRDADAYLDQFAADAAAGTVADLVWFPGATWQPFAVQGFLHPLDDLATRDRWSAPWPGDDQYELQTRFRGKRYLATMAADAHALYFVRDHFDAAAIAYPRADWLYADFQDLAARLTRLVDGERVYGYQWNAGYAPNAPWWRMHNQLEWDRAGEPRTAKWNTSAVIEAYQFQLYDSQYRLKISPSRALLDAEPRKHHIEVGGVAMKVDGPALLARLAQRPQAAPPVPRSGPQAKPPPARSIDVQVLPRGWARKTPHLAILDGQCMTKASTDKEAAWEVAKWLTSDHGQRHVAEAGRMCHTAGANRRLWLPLAKNRLDAAGLTVANLDVFVQALEMGTTALAGEITISMLLRETGLQRVLDEIRDGSASPRAGLDYVQPRIQAFLDGYWAAHAADGR